MDIVEFRTRIDNLFAHQAIKKYEYTLNFYFNNYDLNTYYLSFIGSLCFMGTQKYITKYFNISTPCEENKLIFTNFYLKIIDKLYQIATDREYMISIRSKNQYNSKQLLSELTSFITELSKYKLLQ